MTSEWINSTILVIIINIKYFQNGWWHMDNKAMFQLTYGLYVLTAREGEKDNGCIINTASQVTTTPNQIVVTVNKDNLTHDMIMHTGLFNVSVLTEGASFATFQNFGFQSGRAADKLGKDEFARGENGNT